MMGSFGSFISARACATEYVSWFLELEEQLGLFRNITL